MYLIPPDFTRLIQDLNLSQIITNNQAVLTQSVVTAQAEAMAHLRQKYDTSFEFQDTNLWNSTLIYLAGSRVYLNPAAYDVTKTYTVGQYCLNGTVVYKCASATSIGAFDPAKWTQIGLQYDLYYAINPKPMFNYKTIYKVGDQVYWDGKTYTCAVATIITSDQGRIQARTIQNVPQANVFPDDPENGEAYWGTGTPYNVPINTDILNTTYWTFGDARDAEIVQKITDIALYHLHSRISPKNIPVLRIVRYMGNEDERVIKGNGDVVYPIYSALGWLQGCARGSITPSLPLLQPDQGKRIRFGGNVRNINSY